MRDMGVPWWAGLMRAVGAWSVLPLLFENETKWAVGALFLLIAGEGFVNENRWKRRHD